MEQEMADMETQTTNNATHVIIHKQIRPLTLKFIEVVYKIKTRKEGLFGKTENGEEKIILNGMTGMVQPGEMLAMLGPSGSGKTTLLTALGGRLAGNLSGSITYNDKPFSNAMKQIIGFVTQDDMFYPHLTVTETLVFAALLRLPNRLFTKEEKIAQAINVIAQLGLTKCKDNIIGGPWLRGISGGERKRVSIGQEMLINPSLLFLDEPTSGLDSTIAERIVSTLSELASGGKTIVMTIHQPSSSIYYMFNKVLLLSEGSMMYFGKGSEAMEYFSSIGYAPSFAMTNPSEFLLDLANGKIHQSEEISCKNFFDAKLKPAVLDEIRRCDRSQGVFEDDGFGKWPTSWWQQFVVLLRRDVKERKHESFSGMMTSQVVVIAIFIGLVWYKSNISRLQDQIGLLFAITTFWIAAPLYQAIHTFPQERTMLEKERTAGMYRLSSYYMSRMVADLPMELALPTLFLIITYWMAGLKANAINFLYTLFALLLHVLVSQGLGLAIGATVMDMKLATTLASMVMVIFLMSTGYYAEHMPKFVAWVKYVSLNYYTYQLLLGSQYGTKSSDTTYPCFDGYNGKCEVAEFHMIKNQMGIHMEGQVIAALILVLMLIGYRVITYVALMSVGVTKKLA